MKRLISLLLLTLAATNSYSQIVFEKGYYTDNDGLRVDCLIRFADWKNTPKAFDYKLSENGDVKRATLDEVREFSIYQLAKYVRATVDIDRASEVINDLTHDRNPVFSKETLFLNVLVEGNATLYSYIDGTLKRYFYSTDNGPVNALVYKKYKTPDNQLATNNLFRQQLLDNLICPSITKTSVENLKYAETALVRLFAAYHQCVNVDAMV